METEERRLKIEKIEEYNEELDSKSRWAFIKGLGMLAGIFAGLGLLKEEFTNYSNYTSFYKSLGAVSITTGIINGIECIGKLIDLKVLKKEARAKLGEEEPTLKNIRK